MTQSVELLLDDALDVAVRQQWAALAGAGLPSQAKHLGETNQPHITLAVAASVSPDTELELGNLADHLPLPVRLGGLVCFGGRGGGRQVLARLVVPSAELLAAHHACAASFAGLPDVSSMHQPGAWTPHVTLAMNVPVEQVSAAISVLGEMAEVDGSAVSARRWDSEGRRTWLVAAG